MRFFSILLISTVLSSCSVSFGDSEESDSSKTSEAKLAEIDKLLDSGEDLKAIDVITEEIKKHDDEAVLYKLRGEAHLHLTNYIKSISDLKKAVELDPENDIFLNFLGYAYLESGDYTTAGTVFEEVLILNDQNADAYLNLGVIISKTDGSVQEAYNYYSLAFKIDPLNDMACSNMGYTHLRYGDKDSAQYFLDKALKLNPTNISSLTHRATLYTQLGDYDKAEADIVQYLDYTTGKDKATEYVNLCWLESLRENYEAAVEAGIKAVEADKANLQGHINLGYAYFLSGELQLACEVWSSQEFDPGDDLQDKMNQACQPS